MSETVYDRHAAFYVDFVDRGLASPDRHIERQLAAIAAWLGDRIQGSHICDLCCGEGHLGRFLVEGGADAVVGVDLSARLIDEARRRMSSPRLSYRVDDARTLGSLEDGAFDAVVCQLAMMDVADHGAAFASARRVLKRGGAFVFTVLHPCFSGAPFHMPEAPPAILDDGGHPLAFAVRRYATEGYWESGGDGVRGRMGSYHRTISTYVNDLIAAGFTLEGLEELTVGGEAALFAEAPTVLLIAASAV